MTTDKRKVELGIEVNPEGAKQGLAQIKEAGRDTAQAIKKAGQDAAKGVDAIGAAAAPAAQKLTSAERSIVGSIQRATAAAEAGQRGTSGFFEALGRQRGVRPEVMEPWLAQMRAVEEQTRRTTAAVANLSNVGTSLGATNYSRPLGNPTTSLGATAFSAMEAEAPKAAAVASAALQRVGMSAKATDAALRGLPAQFTDIAVSLQAGQNPLTVFLQQGGQLKDMFGGIGPAARAMGGYMLGLVNPFSVAAAAVGTLTLAYYQGSKEADLYARSIIMTGNAAGTTSAQLATIAANVDKIVGTQALAAETVSALVSTGQVSNSNLQRFTETSIRMQRNLVMSVKESVAAFADLGKDPLRASEKLNESMNYLTFSVYSQIKALQDQGREFEAAELAQRTYATAMDSRTAQLEANLGTIERAWRAIKDGAKEGWDAMLNIGRSGPEAVLINAQSSIEQARKYGGNTLELEEQIRAASRAQVRAIDSASEQAEIARTDKERMAASRRLSEQQKAVRSRADLRADELKRLREDARLVGMEADKLAALEKAIIEKYKDPKVRAPRAYQDDAATRVIAALKEQEAAMRLALTTSEKLTASERELAKFTQQVADLKGKAQLTADQKSLLANEGIIRAQLEQNVAIERQVERKKELSRLDEEATKRAADLARTYAGMTLSLESAAESRRDQYDRLIGTAGMGDRARQETEAQWAIRRESERAMRQATQSASERGLLDSDLYRDQVTKIRAHLDQALADQRKYFDAEKALREDWRVGAASGMANYADMARDVARQSQEAFENAFMGMEDALTKFVTTGKLDFKSLADSIIQDMTRMIIRQQITGPLAGGGGGGFLGKAIGGIIGGVFGTNGLATVASAMPGNSLDNLIGLAGGFGTIANAKGNVFTAPALSAHSNTIVSKPTIFPFAKGIGLMGEAGPEAIMPLRRTPDGRLGVAAAGGGNARPITINVNMPEGSTRKSANQAATAIEQRLRMSAARFG